MGRLLLWAALALLGCSSLHAQRWYYTGKFANEKATPQFFPGALLDYENIFHPASNDTVLYSGGMVLRLVGANVTFKQDEEDLVDSLCKLKTTGTLLEWSVEHSHAFSIGVSENYPPVVNETTNISSSPIMKAEIGLYDARNGVYLEKKWIEITNGNITAVVTLARYQRGDNSEHLIRHRIVFTSDVFGRRALVLHTWDSLETVAPAPVSGSDGRDLRIMTYNLWHNNPLSWVYSDRKQRWARYDRRVRHFAEIVAEEDPDVLAIQEVRLDSSFYVTNDDNTMSAWTADAGFRKSDAGSQVEHLLMHLREAQERLERPVVDYQVLYQPAMFMFDRAKMTHRNEEGLLILSRFSIRQHQALFLPRELGNPSDDHQRMIVVAEVEVPDQAGEEVAVTVGTTHLSLLDRARDKSADALLDFLDHNAHASLNPIQVFTGDLNAEPEESCIQRIMGRACDASSQTCVNDEQGKTGFVDSWVFANPGATVESGHTFPVCNPVKRIDYIFVRNHTCASCHHAAFVTASRIVGSKPTEDTVHLVGSRAGLGMNDVDSPLWASDHSAVVTDVKLLRLRAATLSV